MPPPQPIRAQDFSRIVFFTGAGMSAESGVPTYRGQGGIWHRYRWQDYACQEAFDRDPDGVLDFHEQRRRSVLACRPHGGHRIIAALESTHPRVAVVTQNIDGLHQRAGSRRVVELHGSLWRLRCPRHGPRQELGQRYLRRRCEACGAWLRPDITWFGDRLDGEAVRRAVAEIAAAALFIGIGTSGAVWPAAGFPALARERGARMLEINPEPNAGSPHYHEHLRLPAARALALLLPAI
jgi:NAD-dependent deacetylase